MPSNVIPMNAAPMIGNCAIYQMADKIDRATVFTDQAGHRRAFRVYHLKNQEGVCDVKGEQIVIPARFPHVEISIYYECFIAGDEGTHNGFLDHLARLMFGDERKGWEAFDLDGRSLLNGKRFNTREALCEALDEVTKNWYREGPINMDYIYSVPLYEKPPFPQRIKQYFSNLWKGLRRHIQKLSGSDRVYH